MAQITRRDANLTSDDAVGINLDTYRDRQTGYSFITNLLGTLQDFRIADDGRTTDQAWDGEWESAAADLRLNPDLSVTINGTVNPDFATIEADREQVNLTRFELSLTEKRPFFLEGNELYRQRLRTFYSRRISDIRGGGRVFGKRGPWTCAAMAVGGEASETGDPVPFYSVGSLRRDIGRSTVGATWAERRLDGDGSGSFGADATLFFSDHFGFTGQAIQSFGERESGATAFFLRLGRDAPKLEDRSGPGSRVPESMGAGGRAHRGVQALRERVSQRRDGNHPLL